MDGLFQFFKHIAENYGIVFAVGFLLIVLILFGLYFIVKTFPDIIRDYIQNKLLDDASNHSKMAAKRKNVSIQIQKILSELIEDTNGDRALLFEFSNGISNLAGLPFLFINATSESLRSGTSSVAHLYQRINVSLFADFITELEEKGYFYIEDIEEIKNVYPFIYNFVKPNGTKSMLFYVIYGVDDALGFVILSSVRENFTRKDTLPKIAEVAQKISALLNLEDLEEKIK